MSDTVNQPTSKPTAKVTAAGVGGLIAAVVLWGADALDAFDLPTFWDSTLAAVTAFAAGYLQKAKRSEA